MKKESALRIMLIVGLASVLALSCNVDQAKALYSVVEIDINADGSVTPSNAPIVNVNDTYYTLTDDVNITGVTGPYNGVAIRILRGNIIFNGNGHKLTNGAGYDCFAVAEGINNVTIANSTGIGFNIGLNILSDNNTIKGNTFSGNHGMPIIILNGAGNNYFEGNVIANGSDGIEMAYWGPNNIFNRNYIANNTGTAVFWHLGGGGATFYQNTISGSINGYYAPACTWDNGYPSGGNYWIGYVGADAFSGPGQNITGSDGIADTAKTIDADDIDHYPLMTPAIIPEFSSAVLLAVIMLSSVAAVYTLGRKNLKETFRN